VQGVLAATANPEDPNEVQVSRPSDALAAQAAAKSALNSLLLGLGGVALLVGEVGIANVMVIGRPPHRVTPGVRTTLLTSAKSPLTTRILIEHTSRTLNDRRSTTRSDSPDGTNSEELVMEPAGAGAGRAPASCHA
jgi:hypothetical protein